MTFGIVVKNDYDDVSIDERWLNYSLLVQSSQNCTGGAWTPGNTTPTFPESVINIPTVTSYEPPILFIKHNPLFNTSPGGASISLWYAIPKGTPGNWTGFSLYFGGNHTRLVEYRVYAILPKGEDYGVLVKREDGEIAFDSSRRPLIVERVIQPDEWTLIYNALAGAGFREQEWTLPRPTEDYISVTTVNYFDGIVGVPNGRALTYLNARYDAPANSISHYHLFNSGSGSLNPGAGSRKAILPMLCDAT